MVLSHDNYEIHYNIILGIVYFLINHVTYVST